MTVKRKIIAIISLILIFSAVLSLTACSVSFVSGMLPMFGASSVSESYDTVVVSVVDGEHYRVISANTVRVQMGKSVEFKIEIDEGYEYLSDTAGGRFLNGTTLQIPVVKYPMTIELTVVEADIELEIPVLPENPVEPAPEPEPEPEPEPTPEFKYETVTVEAEKKNGYKFICWTADKSAEEGGTVYSEMEKDTFQVPKGSTPVANYVDVNHHVVLYRTNGGAVAADGRDYYYQTFSNEHYWMPNTIHQDGTFVREGYSLMRYTTEQDGSGDYTTLGGKIEVNENGFVELWLQWAKNTTTGLSMKIETETVSGSSKKVFVTITGYSGDAEQVIIPETVQGYPVMKIQAGAFVGSTMKSLYLPNSIDIIEDGAFRNCTNLEEITLHDTFTRVKDAAFSGCSNLQTYYLNAGRLPVHAGSGEGMFALKYERLRRLTREGGKKIVVVSGSSSLYGFLAQEMQEAFYGEYSVVNYGTNAGTLSHFYIDAFMSFFGEGDIVIQAPETSSTTQYGDVNIEWRMFRGCEVMYEVFSYVDMRQYTKFFTSLSQFNVEVRGTSKGKSYESWSKFLNEYTDMTTNKDANLNNPGYLDGSSKGNPFNANNINDTRVGRLNKLCERVRAQGAEIYMSWAPVNKNYLNDTALNASTQKTFEDRMASKIDYEVISKLSDYIIEGKYFNNSNYHPGPIGASMRTKVLIRDLKAQLAKEGKWDESKYSS